MCRMLRYQKTHYDRAIAGLFHTQKSDEKICEIHNLFVRLDFAEALSRFANIIATLTSGIRIALPLFLPSCSLATPSTL